MPDNPHAEVRPQGLSISHPTSDQVNWEEWERLARTNGVTIDRPRYSVHPVHADITYPMDYGFINGTVSTDGEEVDVFVGTSDLGLVGAIWTTDHRKGDRECKFLLDCSPEQVYLVNGFLNFDRSLMEGQLVLRQPMHELYGRAGGVENAESNSLEGYKPIDCGFYDRLEHWAVLGEECDILLASGAMIRDRFVDFENRGDAEFAHLQSGEQIRLDEIVQVNGIPMPGAAC